jgi:hypothetical protein
MNDQPSINDSILKQQIAANCGGLFDPSLYGIAGYTPKTNLVVEPVEGGFIVTGTFPGVGHRRCVAATPHALVKLLRSWMPPSKTK